MMVKLSVSMINDNDEHWVRMWIMQSKSETQNRKLKCAEQREQCRNMQVPISWVVQDLRKSRCREVHLCAYVWMMMAEVMMLLLMMMVSWWWWWWRRLGLASLRNNAQQSVGSTDLQPVWLSMVSLFKVWLQNRVFLVKHSTTRVSQWLLLLNLVDIPKIEKEAKDTHTHSLASGVYFEKKSVEKADYLYNQPHQLFRSPCRQEEDD